MDEKMHKRAIEKAVEPKFHGKKHLKSKVNPSYPESMEREYLRIINGYMRILNKLVHYYLPNISAAAQEEFTTAARYDSREHFFAELRMIFAKLYTELETELDLFGLRSRLEKLAGQVVKNRTREWKKIVHATLGIDLMNDYYTEAFYQELIHAWIELNVDLIQTIPHETLSNMQEIIYDGFRNGKTKRYMSAEIQNVYGISKRHAQFIARDQMAKLNAKVTKRQQEDAGVTEYIWRDSGDSRVRDSHKRLHGKKFSWNEPPIVDFKTGRRCHPGEDFNCRCTASPVFDLSTLDVPASLQNESEVIHVKV